jgi:capsule polysaccharide export protein KpsE/RkpR
MLDSRKILEQTIQKFDLMKVYKTEKKAAKMTLALKKLRKNIKVSVVSESGLTQNTVVSFSLSVIDKDPQRAADMANFLISSLNATMNQLSWSQYSYSVSFIKGRLDSVVQQKADVQRKLAEFQKANKVYSPEMKEQVLASVATYAELKKQKIMGEIERDLLMVDREGKNREVQFAERKIKELDLKMKQIEKGRNPEVLPGLDYSVDIAYDYLNLVQETEVLTRLEVLLRQQYEETRIKSARQAPEVRVVDKATPPEWKNFPKKSIVVLAIVGPWMTILILSIFVSYGMSRASGDSIRKIQEFREAAGFRAG